METDDTGHQTDDATAFLRAARSGNLEKVIEFLDANLDINTANANGLNAPHLASKDGHVEIVTELLKRGAKVDAATKKGNTALHIASLAGQAEIVKILLEYGASVNIQSQNGFTPLYMAAQENHDQVVKILLCHGANQSLATEDGFTPLAVAMQQGHDKVVSVLLENDSKGKVRLPALHIAAKKDDCKAADLLLQNDHKPDVTSKSGFTPLHIAAHYGNEEIARLLIKRGADVNYLAKHNISPLHVAAKWGKNNMVKILLENSAMIDAKTRDGLTPLHCAARSGHDQVVSTLLENSAPISARTKNGLAPLHMASQGDHVDAARVLLYHRAPVDEVTIDYLTSLHVAAHCGHVRVAKLLLDRKADPNARALNGFTPLHIACKKNRIKVVELLLKHGASIESTTESGLTPLHVASFMGCMNIVIFLLQHEANPDVPTVRGETPLHLAARANQTDIIRILLRNGAKVDARAREQQTPLHIASRLGNVDIVMLLLQHGAAVDTTTKDMYTALHIAAKEGQEEVAAILVENQASVKATTKNGFAPLHIAAKYGNMNVAKILLAQKGCAPNARGKNEITPLHLACHYDHPSVATLLLDKGASPHVITQNGHTPLHIAARKNQMDIASTLLERGADANIESKAGFTPLHLSAQKGHYDMTNLLIEHGADPNHKAKNGLTALHLCAQEDSIRVASILVKNGANIECQTETGYRPIHVAAHFGNLSMIRFLLKHNAQIDVKNNQNYTPLHQAAQQGHAHVVSALLEGNANHKARTKDDLTALNIAQKLGYISVMEVLKGLSCDNLVPNNKNWEEKYKVIAPESLQETNFMSDSDDEGGSDAFISEQPYRYLTADLMKSLRDDSLPIDVTRDDPIHRQVSKEDKRDFVQSSNYCSAENFDMHDGVSLGRLHFRSFLVSFLVDARGGAMKGCRHSGIRIVVPPRRATMPIRVTCRLVKPSKIANPPPLMEGEALATRIVEMGPVAATFLGPVLIDVPHFASARGKEREIIILRSENGETWKEHDNSVDNDDTLLTNTPYDSQMSASYSGRITRIITTEFPQYFAIITRIKQEVHVIGAEGGILISSVVGQVQAVFPPGALTKKIKVGLQAHVIPAELTAKLLGNCVAVSPVITIEPRRRKFHKPITLTIPVPQAANKGMINQYGGETPTLRLLCSIAGGTSEAQWEDVTGSTPLTFMNDRVSFTTTVSARFWLMDCRNIGEVPKMATELYKESLFVPFVTNFVIYSKRMDLLEATLRILCMTDGKEGMHTLEKQEEFLEIVKSRDVEALDGKDLFIEFSGNLVPVTKSGVQLKFTFKAFRQNRLSFHVKVKDPQLDPVARMLFMREPKVAKGEPPQQPVCVLNIVLPEMRNNVNLQKKDGSKVYIEDSNIISQKIDTYKSMYQGENEEKSDVPKSTSPSEQKFIEDTLQKEQADDATIRESFAQKAACPLESVDASYPNKTGEAEDDVSPSAEKQTYSEKRQFWEDITRKRDAFQRSESEMSRTSQLTYNESDSESGTRDEEGAVGEGGGDTEIADESRAVVPDMSECSVAEKAHYFEEQIQKEQMTAAWSTTKVLSQDSLKEKDRPQKPSGKSSDEKRDLGDEVEPRLFEEVTRMSGSEGKRGESREVEKKEVDESIPKEEKQFGKSMDAFEVGRESIRDRDSTSRRSVIEVCKDMMNEERKVVQDAQEKGEDIQSGVGVNTIRMEDKEGGRLKRSTDGFREERTKEEKEEDRRKQDVIEQVMEEASRKTDAFLQKHMAKETYEEKDERIKVVDEKVEMVSKAFFGAKPKESPKEEFVQSSKLPQRITTKSTVVTTFVRETEKLSSGEQQKPASETDLTAKHVAEEKLSHVFDDSTQRSGTLIKDEGTNMVSKIESVTVRELVGGKLDATPGIEPRSETRRETSEVEKKTKEDATVEKPGKIDEEKKKDAEDGKTLHSRDIQSPVKTEDEITGLVGKAMPAKSIPADKAEESHKDVTLTEGDMESTISACREMIEEEKKLSDVIERKVKHKDWTIEQLSERVTGLKDGLEKLNITLGTDSSAVKTEHRVDKVDRLQDSSKVHEQTVGVESSTTDEDTSLLSTQEKIRQLKEKPEPTTVMKTAVDDFLQTERKSWEDGKDKVDSDKKIGIQSVEAKEKEIRKDFEFQLSTEIVMEQNIPEDKELNRHRIKGFKEGGKRLEEKAAPLETKRKEKATSEEIIRENVWKKENEKEGAIIREEEEDEEQKKSMKETISEPQPEKTLIYVGKEVESSFGKVATEMSVGDVKQIRKEFESRIPKHITTVKAKNGKGQKLKEEEASKLHLTTERKISPETGEGSKSPVSTAQPDVTPTTEKKKEFESRIPKRIPDSSGSATAEKEGKKETSQLKKELGAPGVTATKKIEETKRYEEHSSKKKSESQTFSKTFVGGPEEAFKIFEEFGSGSNRKEFGTVITSKLDHKASTETAEREVISSEITSGSDKIISHEEKEHVEKKKTSKTTVTKESPTEISEEQHSENKESDATTIQKASVKVTKGKETIDASATKTSVKNKEEQKFSSLEDKDGLETEKSGTSQVRESDVGVSFTLEKDLSSKVETKREGIDELESKKCASSKPDVLTRIDDLRRAIDEAIVREESREKGTEDSDVKESLASKLIAGEAEETATRRREDASESLEERHARLAKEVEARGIAETLVRSIESEIEERLQDRNALNTGAVDTALKEYLERSRSDAKDSEYDHEKLADNLTKKFEDMLKKTSESSMASTFEKVEHVSGDFGKSVPPRQEDTLERESNRDSMSISEDFTKDEDSSLHDREGSLILSSSQSRLQERDMTMSPSSISDQMDLELMDAELHEPNQTRSAKNVSQKRPADLDTAKKDLAYAGADSTGMVSEISGARVLEILEPVSAEEQFRQDSMDVPSLEMDDIQRVATEPCFRDQGNASMHLDGFPGSFERVSQERDMTVSPSTISEQADTDNSFAQDQVAAWASRNAGAQRADSFEIESPPLFSPRTKVKDLEIKPGDWMIGDEKIEISETLQPSQAFNKELEEYQSTIERQSLKSGSQGEEFNQEGSGTRSSAEGSLVDSVKETLVKKSDGTKVSKFTVTPVRKNDYEYEGELVEDKLDVSCQELIDTLQREYDAKTPTDEHQFVEKPDDKTAENEAGFEITSQSAPVDDTLSSKDKSLGLQDALKQDDIPVSDMSIISKESFEVKEVGKVEEKVEDTVGVKKKLSSEATVVFAHAKDQQSSDEKKEVRETVEETVKEASGQKPFIESGVSITITHEDDEESSSKEFSDIKATYKVEDTVVQEASDKKPILDSEETVTTTHEESKETRTKEPSRKVDKIEHKEVETSGKTSELYFKGGTKLEETKGSSEAVMSPQIQAFDSSKNDLKSRGHEESPHSKDDAKRHTGKSPKSVDKVESRKAHSTDSSDASAFKVKKDDPQSVDLSARYAITVLDQVVKKEIAEVKESLEAAKQDLIEELSENSEAIFQIKDSPSEFQFKLEPESIPNDLPFLYKAPLMDQVNDRETDVPVAKPRSLTESKEEEVATEKATSKDSKASGNIDEGILEKEKEPKSIDGAISEIEKVSKADSFITVQKENEDETGEGESCSPIPIPASRSSSDVENKDESFSLVPPQPAPRRRHKPARAPKKIVAESDQDIGSSSGDSSNYQSCDYETGSGSRPSSSDIEVLQSGLPSGTISEYETALMSVECSSPSRPTSQEYQTAVSSISSRESMKSLNSLSSGHLGSIDSTSEMSETLIASEAEADKDDIDENLECALDEDQMADNAINVNKNSDSSSSEAQSDEAHDEATTGILSRMKRSSEMIFQPVNEEDIAQEVIGSDVKASEGELDQESKQVSELKAKQETMQDSSTSMSVQPGLVRSVDITTSRVTEDGIQSVCTQVTSKEEAQLLEGDVPVAEKTLDLTEQQMASMETDSLETKSSTVGSTAESPEVPSASVLSAMQQASMSTSSTSGMSAETVVEKDKSDRHSPDSDSFELVDKPDIIDDFVVIEEVGREAEEFDSEGKSIRISSLAHPTAKNYDRELENLMTDNKDDSQVSTSQASKKDELFDFDSEESPPQASNEEQYSQSYSDEEQYEGGKKWIEMQFHHDPRAYDIEYDRGPLEDIKEEEITDFEAGSSRFGSLGSHKGSIGSVGSMRGSLGSTPDYDVLAGKKYFTKPIDHDNISLSSLQEFEHLENAVAQENAKKFQCGSQDSVNNGSLPRRYITSKSGHGDDISLSSLKDFEGLEKACREAHMIELRAREEEDLLDHESPENRFKLENLSRPKTDTSAAGSFNPSTSGSDDYEKRIKEIDEIIRIAQANVEKFDRQDDTTDDVSQIEITADADRTGQTVGDATIPMEGEELPYGGEQNVMETSTDSLELEDAGDKKNNPLCRSSDSLDMKTTLDFPSLSSDSLNNVRDDHKEVRSDSMDQFNRARRISSDSLDLEQQEQRAESNSYCSDVSAVEHSHGQTVAPTSDVGDTDDSKKKTSPSGHT